jgi:hypothetical protein
MKKIYFFAASMVLGVAAVAQTSQEIAKPVRAAVEVPVQQTGERPTATTANAGDRFTVIWEDDFSNEDNWTFNNTSVPDTDWFITTDPDAPPFAALTPIATPTVDNGYALVDGDSQGDGSEQNANLRMANPVDLTGYDVVNLRFFCVTRNWQSEYTVRVSNDGENWVDFPVLTEITTNTNTDNPQVVVVNISSVAANQETVWVEWNFTASWGWFWAVDDVSIVVPDANDLTISDPRYTDHDPNTDSWCNVEYSSYSTDQVRPLTFKAAVFNAGTDVQTGVRLQVEVTNGIDVDELVLSDSISIAPGETDTLLVGPWTPPATVATYDITYTLIQDQEDANEDDNVDTRSFEITDGVMARDEGSLDAIAALGLDDFWGGPGYCFESDGEIHCIGAAISSTSTIDAFFDFELRAFSATGLDYVANTDLLQVNEELLNDGGGNTFHWGFLEGGPVPVFAGDEYVAMFHTFSGTEQGTIGISGQAPDFSVYIIAEFDTQSCDPCYTNSTYMVRIGMSEEFCEAAVSVGADEIEMVSVEELFPNPTAGATTLQYNLLETANVQVFLFDNNGRVIMNNDYGTQPAGEQRFEYDFSDVAAGMYTFSIKVNDNFVNKKLVIR